MSPMGVWLASVSPGWLVICVAAIVIGFSAFKMFKKAVKCAPTPRAGRAAATRRMRVRRPCPTSLFFPASSTYRARASA